MDNYTKNLINKNSPLAASAGQDAYRFDAGLKDTGLDSSNFKPAGGNQTVQFNNNGTVAGNSNYVFNPTNTTLRIGKDEVQDGVLILGGSGHSGFLRGDDLWLIAGNQLLLRVDGTVNPIQFRTGGDNVRLLIHANGSVVFNEGGSSAGHVRFKGDANDNILFVNADTNNVGVLTASPNGTAALDVNGFIMIEGGNPSAGRYLVSDASGLGSWQDLSVTNSQITDYDLAKGTGDSINVNNVGTFGTVQANAAFNANGTLGISTTVTILDRNAGVGTITHALTFTYGLLTAYGTS